MGVSQKNIKHANLQCIVLHDVYNVVMCRPYSLPNTCVKLRVSDSDEDSQGL